METCSGAGLEVGDTGVAVVFAEETCTGMVTMPGELTGKVVPEMTTAVDPGGTEVMMNDVICVTDVVGGTGGWLVEAVTTVVVRTGGGLTVVVLTGFVEVLIGIDVVFFGGGGGLTVVVLTGFVELWIGIDVVFFGGGVEVGFTGVVNVQLSCCESIPLYT